jgi:hypothetical protein
MGAAVWFVLAFLTTRRLPLMERLKMVCAGVGAALIWFPAWFLVTLLVPFAIYMTFLGFIPLAIVPFVLWGAFCIALSLSRSAVTTLLSSSSGE